MIRIIFLGTGSMMPTKYRNLISIAIEYNENLFLFDCGENTQKQIKLAKLHPIKINKIFISHWHGDHVLGLLGLLQTLNTIDNFNGIEIYGPVKTKRFMNHLLKSTIFYPKFEIKINEIDAEKSKLIIENKDYEVHALNLKHSVSTIGYLFKQKNRINFNKEKLKELDLLENPILKDLKKNKVIKYNSRIIKLNEVSYVKEGKTIAVILDTRPFEELIRFVKGVDYLIIESTMSSMNKDKAEEYFHLTAKEAALIAKKAKVRNLVLTHFSQRYKDISIIEKESKKIFPNTIISKDLMKIDVLR